MTIPPARKRIVKSLLPLLTVLLTFDCSDQTEQRQRRSASQSQGESVEGYERATLAGITGVFVVLDGPSPDVEALGVDHAELLQEIQNQLRSGGVDVLSREEARTHPGSPYLYVNVNVVRGVVDYAYSIRVELNQAVHLERVSNVRTVAATWQPAAVLAAVDSLVFVKELRQDVRTQVAQFLHDYRLSNPRR